MDLLRAMLQSVRAAAENRMSKIRLAPKLTAIFKRAFAPKPLQYFYLEGRPFLDEPYHISTRELGNLCLLNGVSFHLDGDLGCQTRIEDRAGLIAAERAAGSEDGEQNLRAVTRWRRYNDDDGWAPV
jgi:hypothetical protein